MEENRKISFVHTADLHLGQKVDSLADRASYGLVKNAPFKVLASIVEYACNNNVDAILFCGDVFHSEKPAVKIVDYFVEQLQILHRNSIQVVICPGNHDPYTLWERIKNKLPDNVYVFEKNQVGVCAIYDNDNKPVCLFTGRGIDTKNSNMDASLLTGISLQDLAAEYSDAAQFPFSVCALHIGQSVKNKYDAFDFYQLCGLGHDYYALGHIHLYDSQEFPGCKISYCGTPQGQDVGEPVHTLGDESLGYSFNHVEIYNDNDTKKVDVKQVPSGIVAWNKLQIDISDCQSYTQVYDTCLDICNDCLDSSCCDFLATDINLVGTTTMHKYFEDASHLEELKRQISADNNIYCRKIDVFTEVSYKREDLLRSGGVCADIIKTSERLHRNHSTTKQILLEQFNDNKSAALIAPGIVDKIDIDAVIEKAEHLIVSNIRPKDIN